MSVNNRIKTEKDEAKQLQQEQMKKDQIHQQEFELQLAERGINWKNKIVVSCFMCIIYLCTLDLLVHVVHVLVLLCTMHIVFAYLSFIL